MGQDSVKLCWEKLNGFLTKMANEFIDQRYSGSSDRVGANSNSSKVNSETIKRVVRGGVAHMLHRFAESEWNPGQDLKSQLVTKSYKDFLTICINHKLLIQEHPTLIAIRRGRPVLRVTANYFADYISDSIGRRITVDDLIVVSDYPDQVAYRDEEGLEAVVPSRGPIADVAIADLTECLAGWPELVAQLRKVNRDSLPPVSLLLSKGNLSSILDDALHSAVSECLASEMKSGRDIVPHWEIAKRILGNLCILEVSPEWLQRVGTAVGNSGAILEVSVETAFGVEVVRAGRWGGEASFCPIEKRKIPVGEHAILFDPDADECGASFDVAVETVLRSVWSRLRPDPDDELPADVRLSRDAQKLKELNRALNGDRKKFRRYHHLPVNLQTSSVVTVAGVRHEVARLLPELHVIIWGTASNEGLPVFRGDETHAWNSVAEFLLIPSFLKEIR